MGVHLSYFSANWYAGILFFEILVLMCRTRVQQGKNEGAECAARASIWSRIGMGFRSFSTQSVFSKAVSSQCADTIVLRVILQVFFRFLGQPTFENVFKSS